MVTPYILTTFNQNAFSDPCKTLSPPERKVWAAKIEEYLHQVNPSIKVSLFGGHQLSSIGNSDCVIVVTINDEGGTDLEIHDALIIESQLSNSSLIQRDQLLPILKDIVSCTSDDMGIGLAWVVANKRIQVSREELQHRLSTLANKSSDEAMMDVASPRSILPELTDASIRTYFSNAWKPLDPIEPAKKDNERTHNRKLERVDYALKFLDLILDLPPDERMKSRLPFAQAIAFDLLSRENFESTDDLFLNPYQTALLRNTNSILALAFIAATKDFDGLIEKISEVSNPKKRNLESEVIKHVKLIRDCLNQLDDHVAYLPAVPQDAKDQSDLFLKIDRLSKFSLYKKVNELDVSPEAIVIAKAQLAIQDIRLLANQGDIRSSKDQSLSRRDALGYFASFWVLPHTERLSSRLTNILQYEIAKMQFPDKFRSLTSRIKAQFGDHASISSMQQQLYDYCRTRYPYPFQIVSKPILEILRNPNSDLSGDLFRMRIYSERSSRNIKIDNSQYDGHPPDVVAWIALGMLRNKYSPLNREDFSIKTFRGLDAVISLPTEIMLENEKKISLQVQAVSTPYRDRAKTGVPPILPIGNLSRMQRAMGLTLTEYAQKIDPSFPSNPDFYSVCEPTHFPNPSVRQLRTSLNQLEVQPTGSLGDIKPVGFLTGNGLHILYVPINEELQRGVALSGGEIFDSRNSPLPHFLPKVIKASEDQIRKTSHDAKFYPVGIRFSRRDTKINYSYNFDITVATIGDDELLLKVLEPLSQHGWNITSIEITQNPINAEQKIHVRALKPKDSADTSKELVSQLTDIRIPIKTSSESGVWLRPYDFDIHLDDQPGMLLELYKAIHKLGGSISKVKYITEDDDSSAHKVTMWLPDMNSPEEAHAQLKRFTELLISEHACCSTPPITYSAPSYRKFGSVAPTKDEIFTIEQESN